MKPVKQKKITKEARADTLKEYARAFEFEYKPKIIDLTKDKEECRKVTEGSCWRPDIYLDEGCIKCALFENCACASKVIPKSKRSSNT